MCSPASRIEQLGAVVLVIFSIISITIYRIERTREPVNVATSAIKLGLNAKQHWDRKTNIRWVVSLGYVRLRPEEYLLGVSSGEEAAA